MAALSPSISLRLLSLYPKKIGSAAVGAAARATLPVSLRPALLGRFARTFGIDLSEAEKDLTEYTSFQALFTRRLKPGSRPQAAQVSGSINSPVDGAIVASGRIEEGLLIQAKGLPYRLDELLFQDPLSERFLGAHYLTLYLSPRDYHRIHVPCEGKVVAAGRVEGELWPVNEASTARTPSLYVRNRRSYWIAEGTGACSSLMVGAVLVAATHVGGAVVDPIWLDGQKLPLKGRIEVPGKPCHFGDDLGTFELGSTVVLLIGGPGAGRWEAVRETGPVRVGERLGRFRP